jgi:thymidylate synthase ThyX
MHRHRRCQQIRQDFGFHHGYDIPDLLVEAGTEDLYRSAMEGAARAAKDMPEEAAAYLLPFGYRVRCLFKMDFAEAEYVSRLRSGVKGHFSYRGVAWQMKEKLAERHPYLAAQIEATPPSVEDSLKR